MIRHLNIQHDLMGATSIVAQVLCLSDRLLDVNSQLLEMSGVTIVSL